MQRRHAQRSYLGCQGWAESPSRRLVSWPSQQTSRILAPIPHSYVECHYCRHTLQGSAQPQDDNTIFRRAARNACWEKLPIRAKLGRELTCDVERALVQSQVQKQGRRLHDEENDIDGKLTQFNVSSCTEKLFLSHYHNQLAPSCTSVGCRREY